MIKGVGTDIVDIRRIEDLIKKSGNKFLHKVFNKEEFGNDAAHYAKRFAAKEAISKAFGCGIGQLKFKDIIITNNTKGAPMARIKKQHKNIKIHISLADEYPYATAYAVIEEK